MSILKDTLPAKISSVAKNLHPAYFALVMATGIVSISSMFLRFELIAWWLFWINIFFYISLWFLTALRIIFHTSDFLRDLKDHNKGPGFFTIIAGTCVLGSQFVIIKEDLQIAVILWLLGAFTWIILTYTFFTIVTIKEDKPPLEKGINGTWLIIIVSTQSVAILGTLIIPAYYEFKEVMYFSMFVMFLIGCMLYIIIIALIFYRLFFFKLSPSELTQPYWINMGAVAITTLAGSVLILNSSYSNLHQGIIAFVEGFTLFFWSIGTWWIPLLFIFGYWRHIYKKFSLKYDPQYWGMVFPLGMYVACTYKLSEALELEFLKIISQYFIYIALAAWSVSFILLVYHTINGWKGLKSSNEATSSKNY